MKRKKGYLKTRGVNPVMSEIIGKTIQLDVYNNRRVRIVSIGRHPGQETESFLMAVDIIGTWKLKPAILGETVNMHGNSFKVRTIKGKRIVFESIPNSQKKR